MFRLDQGIPAINGDPLAVSNNVFTGNPNGDIADYHSYHSTLVYERILNDDWTLRVGEMSLWYNTPSTTTFLDNGTSRRGALITNPLIGQDQSIANPFLEQNHDILETLGGEFETGEWQHKAVFGAEQDWFITNHDTFTTTSTTNLITAGPGQRVWADQRAFGGHLVSAGSVRPIAFPTSHYARMFSTTPSFRQNRFGFFAQDMIDITDRLHVTLGGRFDYMNQEYARSDYGLTFPACLPRSCASQIRTVDTFHQFSPRAGITYDLIPDYG